MKYEICNLKSVNTRIVIRSLSQSGSSSDLFLNKDPSVMPPEGIRLPCYQNSVLRAEQQNRGIVLKFSVIEAHHRFYDSIAQRVCIEMAVIQQQFD